MLRSASEHVLFLVCGSMLLQPPDNDLKGEALEEESKQLDQRLDRLQEANRVARKREVELQEEISSRKTSLVRLFLLLVLVDASHVGPKMLCAKVKCTLLIQCTGELAVARRFLNGRNQQLAHSRGAASGEGLSSAVPCCFLQATRIRTCCDSHQHQRKCLQDPSFDRKTLQ